MSRIKRSSLTSLSPIMPSSALLIVSLSTTIARTSIITAIPVLLLAVISITCASSSILIATVVLTMLLRVSPCVLARAVAAHHSHSLAVESCCSLAVVVDLLGSTVEVEGSEEALDLVAQAF